jgi:dephospho-CoA kinase
MADAPPAGDAGILRVALTGGIATGKSYVRQRLEDAGLPTIDADVLAREALATGGRGYDAVLERFGPDIVAPDGTIDRARLGAVVFADAQARADLEAIVHPIVYEQIEGWYAQLARDGYRGPAVADIPLLFETGRHEDFDVVVVAMCAPDVQLARVQARDGLDADAAARRIAAQWPTEAKALHADLVVHTDRSFEDTDAQVRELAVQLRRQAG